MKKPRSYIILDMTLDIDGIKVTRECIIAKDEFLNTRKLHVPVNDFLSEMTDKILSSDIYTESK